MNRTSLQSYACALRAGAGMRPASALQAAFLVVLLSLLALAGQAQTSISTLSSWDGAKAAYPLGVPASVAADVYGQVFTVPANSSILTDFKINVAWSWGQGVSLTAYIAPWDGAEASDIPLWSSSANAVDSSQSSFRQLDFQIPNLSLTSGNQYVFYLVATNASGGPAAARVGVTGVTGSSPSGGSFVFTRTYGDSANLLYPWEQPDGSTNWGDTAFAATFANSLPSPVPASLEITGPAVATAGSAFQFTVTAYDVYGNVQDAYSGPVQFRSSDGSALLPSNSQLTGGVGTFQATLNTTGSQTITVTDVNNSSLSSTSGAITVSTGSSSSSGSAGPVDHLAFSNLPNFSSGSGNIQSGTTFSSTVTAYDANGNVVTGYTGTVHFTSNDYAALLPIDTALVNGVGNFGFGLICYSSPCTLTATDAANSSLTVTSAPINVTSPPTVPHLVLALFPVSTAAGTQFNGVIGAFDQYGAPMPGFADTVHITSTDPNVSIEISTPPLPPMPWSDGPLPGGTAAFTFVMNTAGVQTITATDVSNSAITGASNAITVVAGSPTSLAFSGMPTTITPGTQFQATVSGNDAQGNVTTGLTDVIHFTSSDPSAVLPSNTALVKGSGTFTFTLNTPGAQTITATDTIVSSLTATSSPVTVQQSGPAGIHVVSGSGQMTGIGTAFAVPLKVKVIDSNGNAVSGATVLFSAPATGAGATFSSSTATTATDGTASVTATANGTVSSTSYTVAATVTGVSSPANFTLINQQANTTVQLSASPASPVYGQSVTLTATLTPSSAGGVVPTGTFIFRDGITELTSSAGLTSGTNGLTSAYALQTPAAGAHSFGAIYSGDNNFWYSETRTPLTVAKASSSLKGPTTLPNITTASGGTIPIQVSGQFSGTGIATPSGNISYTVDGGSAVTAPISAGSASVALSAGISAGAHAIQVSYGGDTNYAAAANLTINLTVASAKKTPTITWVQAITVHYGSSLSGVLNASASANNVTVSGTFAYSATPVGGGTAMPLTVTTVLNVGSYALSASFTPTDTASYNTATSSATLTVAKATVSITVAASTNPVFVSNAVTFTSAVTAAGGSPTGPISFYDGGTLIGSVALSNGSASYTTSSLSTGSHSITAVYGGDANFSLSTSSAVTEVVQDFTLGGSGGSGGSGTTQTVPPGGTANYSFSIGPSGGSIFPTPVTFSLNGLPPGATGTLSPTSLPAGSSLTTVALTIQLPQIASLDRSRQPQPTSRQLPPLVWGVLLLPFAARLRRAGKRLARGVSLLLVLAAGIAVLVGVNGCGGKSGFFGQQQQTYTITVTATSGSLSRSTNLTLIVE